MVERRSAAAALDVDSRIKDFISAGVPAKPQVVSVVEEPADVPVAGSGKEDAVTGKEPERPVRKKSASKERRTEFQATIASPAYAQTLARARIQKSVRFLPKLIAGFEEYCQHETLAGRKPISIQDALNEALDNWLNSKSRFPSHEQKR